MNLNEKAPITEVELEQLKADAANVRAAAERKQLTLNHWEEARESEIAKKHFDLGCWLYYYSQRIYRTECRHDRVDCALRLFLSGLCNPHYDFFTVFDFGERQFDTLFEMGDSVEVIDALRQHLPSDKTGSLRKAFDYYGWSYRRIAEITA